jgi:ribosome maturation factor RimP
MSKSDELTEMLRPAVEALDYELVGVEYIGQGKHSVLRIYIDHENGINVDDCASVSHQASGILEVEDPIKSAYTLEVSSPGVNRPLFTMAHFEASVGEVVDLRCHVGIDGRRKFKGELKQAQNEVIILSVDGEDYELSFADIDKANVEADFDKLL